MELKPPIRVAREAFNQTRSLEELAGVDLLDPPLNVAAIGAGTIRAREMGLLRREQAWRRFVWPLGSPWPDASGLNRGRLPVLGEGEGMSIAPFVCGTCEFRVEHPVARMSSATLGLLPDSRLVGRCVLVRHEHDEHFEELPLQTAEQFMQDAARAARAIRAVTGVSRINYAMFCNQVSHLHLHLAPRGGVEDLNPLVSPWELSGPEAGLDPKRLEEVKRALAKELQRVGAD